VSFAAHRAERARTCLSARPGRSGTAAPVIGRSFPLGSVEAHRYAETPETGTSLSSSHRRGPIAASPRANVAMVTRARPPRGRCERRGGLSQRWTESRTGAEASVARHRRTTVGHAEPQAPAMNAPIGRVRRLHPRHDRMAEPLGRGARSGGSSRRGRLGAWRASLCPVHVGHTEHGQDGSREPPDSPMSPRTASGRGTASIATASRRRRSRTRP